MRNLSQKQYGLKRKFFVTLTLVLTGIILGTLGAFSLPVGFGISDFWPGIVVQVNGGIWFGAWGGLLSASVFPVFSNLLIGGTTANVIGFIPANIVQGIIPTWAFRHYRMAPDIPGRTGLVFFLLWGSLLPCLCGGLVGAASLVLFGEADWDQYFNLAWSWARPNILVSFLLGVPALRVLTPIWREYDLLVRGYWR